MERLELIGNCTWIFTISEWGLAQLKIRKLYNVQYLSQPKLRHWMPENCNCIIEKYLQHVHFLYFLKKWTFLSELKSHFPDALSFYKWNVAFTLFSSRKFTSLLPNSAVISSGLNDPGLICMSMYFNKPLKYDPKGELGHFQSGVFDLPCVDPSLATIRFSGNSLCINVIILS